MFWWYSTLTQVSCYFFLSRSIDVSGYFFSFVFGQISWFLHKIVLINDFFCVKTRLNEENQIIRRKNWELVTHMSRCWILPTCWFWWSTFSSSKLVTEVWIKSKDSRKKWGKCYKAIQLKVSNLKSIIFCFCSMKLTRSVLRYWRCNENQAIWM